jgi:NADPH-dependent ferric siderophore reductase
MAKNRRACQADVARDDGRRAKHDLRLLSCVKKRRECELDLCQRLRCAVMANFAEVVGHSLKKLFLRELNVVRVTRLTQRFERVDFASDALRGVRFAAGDKVQIALAGGTRTYTPFSFDAARGALSLLVYLHGDGPSAVWAKGLSEGDRAYAFGPRGSLALASESGPLLLFGDETSFALARALLESRGSASGLSFVFETAHPGESSAVSSALGLQNAELVERRQSADHGSEVEARVRAILARDSSTRLVLTGKAQSIQELRKRLKAQPLAHAGQLVKAYWAPGKRGLD